MSIRLSEFELDVMTHFWSDRELSAPELYERIGGERGVAYSTVKTIVDRLEQKGAIERVANRGRTIFYAPVVKRERVRKPLVKAFLRRLFGDDLRPAVRAAAAGREAERRRARVPAQARRRSRAEQEVSALGETLLTALCLSGLAACCLVLLPRTPPRVRFAIAVAGLAAWVVPWGAIRIALPSSSRGRSPARRMARRRRRRGAAAAAPSSTSARRSATPSPPRSSSASCCSCAIASRCGAACARGAPAAGPPTICARCCRASSPDVAAEIRIVEGAPSRPHPACCGRRSGSATGTREAHRTLVARARDVARARARSVLARRDRGRAARVLVEPARRVPRTPSRADDRVDLRPPLRRAVRQSRATGASSPRCCSPRRRPRRGSSRRRRGESRRATAALARRTAAPARPRCRADRARSPRPAPRRRRSPSSSGRASVARSPPRRARARRSRRGLPATPAGDALATLIRAANGGDSELLAELLGAYTPQELAAAATASPPNVRVVDVLAQRAAAHRVRRRERERRAARRRARGQRLQRRRTLRRRGCGRCRDNACDRRHPGGAMTIDTHRHPLRGLRRVLRFSCRHMLTTATGCSISCKATTLEGEINSVQWVNPHIVIYSAHARRR